MTTAHTLDRTCCGYTSLPPGASHSPFGMTSFSLKRVFGGKAPRSLLSSSIAQCEPSESSDSDSKATMSESITWWGVRMASLRTVQHSKLYVGQYIVSIL